MVSYHSDPWLAQSQTQPWSNQQEQLQDHRCTSGGTSLSFLSSCCLERHLTPKQPHEAISSCSGSLGFHSYLLSPVRVNLPYLLRDLQERLAGEPKSRFTLSRHKWKSEQERWIWCKNGLDQQKHWIDGLALRQKNLYPSPLTPAPPPTPCLHTCLNSETKTPLGTSSINQRSRLSPLSSAIASEKNNKNISSIP